jgi:hypothetical protein
MTVLLDEINTSAPILTLAVTILIAVIAGSKVVYKYIQKRNLAILNQRIDSCINDMIKPLKVKTYDNAERIGKLETKIHDIFEFFIKGKQD